VLLVQKPQLPLSEELSPFPSSDLQQPELLGPTPHQRRMPAMQLRTPSIPDCQSSSFIVPLDLSAQKSHRPKIWPIPKPILYDLFFFSTQALPKKKAKKSFLAFLII
jgi:hypothetical protein